MNRIKLTRRTFMIGSAASVAGILGGTALRSTPRKVSANDKLNIAAIGAGGKGKTDINGCADENVVALCDVDWERAAETFSQFPNAKKYSDYRDLLEKENLDAVTVSTPDHNHAHAAYMAMKMGKHVYVQKPLTYTVAEARLLRNTARETGVVTQMGNQGHSWNGTRRFVEIVQSGVIGDVKECHLWTNRPVWPQGVKGPIASEAVPATMNWDSWIGTSQWRPYNAQYAPFAWRGFIDFGAGALGDMACHIGDPANWALRLSEVGPTSVEAIQNEGMTDISFPNKSVIKYEFPARGDMPPLDLYWHDGGNLPKRPKDVSEDVQLGEGDNGTLLVGTKGYLTCDTYGDNPRLLPEDKFEGYEMPPESIPRIEYEHQWKKPYVEWTRAIKAGEQPGSNFNYSGPLTEWVVMGNLALKYKGKLKWDAQNMKVTNRPEANKDVTRVYRRGWELPV